MPLAKPQELLAEFPALDIDAMISCCQKVYFATEPYSIAIFILTNISLIWLLRDFSKTAAPKDQINSLELIRYQNFLPENVDIAIQKLPLMIVPSTENISALLLSVCLETAS